MEDNNISTALETSNRFGYSKNGLKSYLNSPKENSIHNKNIHTLGRSETSRSRLNFDFKLGLNQGTSLFSPKYSKIDLTIQDKHIIAPVKKDISPSTTRRSSLSDLQNFQATAEINKEDIFNHRRFINHMRSIKETFDQSNNTSPSFKKASDLVNSKEQQTIRPYSCNNQTFSQKLENVRKHLNNTTLRHISALSDIKAGSQDITLSQNPSKKAIPTLMFTPVTQSINHSKIFNNLSEISAISHENALPMNHLKTEQQKSSVKLHDTSDFSGQDYNVELLPRAIKEDKNSSHTRHSDPNFLAVSKVKQNQQPSHRDRRTAVFVSFSNTQEERDPYFQSPLGEGNMVVSGKENNTLDTKNPDKTKFAPKSNSPIEFSDLRTRELLEKSSKQPSFIPIEEVHLRHDYDVHIPYFEQDNTVQSRLNDSSFTEEVKG